MLKTFFSKVPAGHVEVRGLVRDMVRRADAARDAGRFAEAATLYVEALRLAPGRTGIAVQAAHMLKEVGDHAAAEEHYLRASAMTPDDADLALQLGHFYRGTGRTALAEASYVRATELKPGWDIPVIELDRMRVAGWGPVGDDRTMSTATAWSDEAASVDFDDLPSLYRGNDVDRVVRDLIRRPPEDLLHGHAETIEFRRLGRHERTHWGILPTVRGIEALRGFRISATPIMELQIHLNDQLIYRGPVRGGYVLKHEGRNPVFRKYVFNVWFDFTGFVDGRYDIDFRFTDAKQRTQGRSERIVVARPLDPARLESSDGFIALASDDSRPLADRINALPSMVRPGRRALLPRAPQTILVQRADQLGDLIVSVPALRRLRDLFPGARIIGLLSQANHELAATLGLFDDIIVIDFPEDRWEQRRIMSASDQAQLRAKLATYQIDVAIDMSENIWSRYLLLLTDAPFTFGFRSGGMPSLTVEIEGFTHDRIDNHEIVPHTNKQLGMIEWLGAMVRSEANLLPRRNADWADLRGFGLAEGDRFVVLHDGARLHFSRWSHYPALAAMLLERTDLKVVMFTDDPDLHSRLPADLAVSERFRLVDRRAAFTEFDTLLSLCTVFVGNDSGPKHLASLRGAKVVSIHMARNNWNEWGQENGGFIISRKVPCTGCLIHYDPEECGRDFACMTGIKTEEVFSAVTRLIDEVDAEHRAADGAVAVVPSATNPGSR